MSWLQLRINTNPEDAKNIEDAMQKAGALSITLEDNADQPIFEPELGETPLWQETRVTGLFNADIDSAKTLDNISHQLGGQPEFCQWQILEDKDWEREWMAHYQPIQCHDDFWICPSWIDAPDPNATNLLLDPGLAFGTGTHPTTFLCLKWLAQQSFEDKTVIDYGCGSGILGIGALLRGAPQVVGTDIDPQALLATRENVKRNHLDPERFPVYFPSKCPEEPVDILLANILAGPLVDLAPKLAKLTKQNGKICLSGILSTQQNKVVNAYKDSFTIDHIDEKDNWVCITGTKK